MKIVQVINSLNAGGAEVFTCQLAVALARKGNNVTLITYQGPIGEKGEILNKYLIMNNVKPVHFNRGKSVYSKYINPFLLIKNEIKKISPDVIHAHLQWSDIYVAGINFLALNKYKIVRTVHNKRRTSKFSKFLDRIFYNYYNRNIACSDFVKNNYVDEKLRKILISIPNGIDISLIKEKRISKTKLDYRLQLNIPKDKTIFINIGSMYLSDNIIAKKNQGLIIEAFSILSNKEDVEVVFLGDGTLREKYEKRCEELGIKENFKFEGNVASPYEYILASDFCLMPSLDEGLPIALIETVCSGLATIVSNIEAFQPFDSESVVRLATFDPKELANEMEKMIIRKEFFLHLGKDKIKYFESLFDINLVAEKYFNLYRETLNSEKHPYMLN